MLVRSVTADDLGAVVRVKLDAIRPVYEPLGDPLLASDYDPRQQNAWLGHLLGDIDEECPFLVAVDDAGVAGWVRLGRDRDGDELAAEIRGLFVAPSRQGIGIGRSLVADGFGRMQALGYTSAKVQTLRGSPACEFYERLGGQLEGFVPFRGRFEESVYRWPSLQ